MATVNAPTYLEQSYTRNTRKLLGQATVNAADSLVTGLGVILVAFATLVVDGSPVSLTWSGGTITIGSEPSSESVNFYIEGR